MIQIWTSIERIIELLVYVEWLEYFDRLIKIDVAWCSKCVYGPNILSRLQLVVDVHHHGHHIVLQYYMLEHNPIFDHYMIRWRSFYPVMQL